MAKGIDCATPLTAALANALAAAEVEFCCRYLVPQQYKWKRLTREEAKGITAAGLKIVSVFETTADRARQGAPAGMVDGQAAQTEARTIGQPAGSTIYFAVDYDAQPEDCDAIEQYLKQAASQLPDYKVGVYGSHLVVEEMARRKVCRHFWQTYAWSAGKQSPKANIYQYRNGVKVAGIDADLNHSYGGEGWWSTI